MFRLLFILLCFLPIGAVARHGNMPVYGIPTLYGEYELSPADVSRARALYGPAQSHKVRPMRALGVAGKGAAKHPVKIKSVKPKKNKKHKKKPFVAPVIKQAIIPMPTRILVRVPKPIIRRVMRPSPYAVHIADRAAYKYDVDTYCTHRGPLPSGNLPDGIILMPGRPDLMCCIDRAQD